LRLSYSNLGVIGFIIGTAAGRNNIAAGIGYYGAAISIYERWIEPGREVTFARDTRLVLQIRPRHSMLFDPNAIEASPLNH
jgi:hypothetical protein